MSLPQIQIPAKLYSIVKIIFLVSAFLVVAINILSATAAAAAASALPGNTTDWNWGISIVEHNGSSGYPDNYYDDDNGYPNELVDDDLMEDEEEQDEQEHADESKEWDSDENNEKK